MKRIVSYIVILLVLLFPCVSIADDFVEDSSPILGIEINVSSNISEVPKINARHAVVIERNSNIVLYGKNENENCKMASTTKIMTATVVLENCNDLKEMVTVSKKAARYRWF